jgi:hypothetical protein
MSDGYTADPVAIARLGLKTSDLAKQLSDAWQIACSHAPDRFAYSDDRVAIDPSFQSFGDSGDFPEFSLQFPFYMDAYVPVRDEAAQAIKRLLVAMAEDTDALIAAAFAYADVEPQAVRGFERLAS